ncbi:MAG: response regulator [Gemmatimonadales bacterium]|nr:response regulator [Gemmatimonadales bacterium]
MILATATDDRHRLATMASPTGIFLIDASGELTFANPRLLAMARTDEGALQGLGFLRYLHPDDRDAAVTRIAEQLVTGGDARGDFRLICPRRAGGWVRVWTSAIRDDEGAITGLAGVLEDITEVRTEEERARALEVKVQQTHKLESLGLLAGGIAHDFNNLLVGIMGNASLAQLDLAPGSPAADALSDLQLAAERATDLTAQLMAYAGRGTRAAQPVALSAAVEETFQLLRTSFSPRARIALDLDPALPAVRGDGTRLRQVVMNLLTNASDALEGRAGEIAVRTSVQMVDEAARAGLAVDGGIAPGPAVCLEVSDTGCGMDEATLARIFDPFFSTKAKGRGLGLAALVGTVRAHAGGLRVTSAPGAGTTFQLLLPPDRPAPAATPAAQASPATAPPSCAVLVVDDEASVRDVSRRVLARAGFEVIEAADGASAVKRYAESKGRIRCVLLDMSMPGMGGPETFKAIREIDPTARVVITSGHCESDVNPLFPPAALAGFLQKPYDLASLVRVAKTVAAG